jgi:hypothetical protein
MSHAHTLHLDDIERTLAHKTDVKRRTSATEITEDTASDSLLLLAKRLHLTFV